MINVIIITINFFFNISDVKVSSNSHTCHSNLGIILSKEGQHEKALDSYKKAIQFNPNHLNANINIANTLLMLGRLFESKKYFEKVINLYPNNPEAAQGYGKLLLKLNIFCYYLNT